MMMDSLKAPSIELLDGCILLDVSFILTGLTTYH